MDGVIEVNRHNCGHCIYHLPNKAAKYGCNQPSRITSGKGKDKRSYWLCRCRGCSYNGKGRVSEDGENCSHFVDRYDENRLYKWLEESNDRDLNDSGYWKQQIVKGVKYEVYRFRLGKGYQYFYGITRGEAKEKYDEFVLNWRSKNG